MREDPYKKIAFLYDTLTKAFLQAPRETLARICQEQRAQRILEVGCGTGTLLRLFPYKTNLLVGLDYSAAMLARAAGAPCYLVRGNGQALPFIDQTFDVVIFSLILHETPEDPVSLLHEGLRLAPNVVVLDWRMPERNLDCLCTAWVPLVERLAGAGHYQRFKNFMAAGGIRGLAARAGVEIVYEKSLACASLVLAVCRYTPIGKKT